MKKIVTLMFFSLFSTLIFAADLTKCDFQGNNASTIIGLKSRGVSLEQIKTFYMNWYVKVMANAEEGIPPQDKSVIIEWTKEKEKEVGLAKWFETVYNKYGVDFREAFIKESEACLASTDS